MRLAPPTPTSHYSPTYQDIPASHRKTLDTLENVEKIREYWYGASKVEPIDDNSCYLSFEAYYDPVGVWNALMNALVLRRMFRKRSLSVMEGIRRLAEK